MYFFVFIFILLVLAVFFLMRQKEKDAEDRLINAKEKASQEITTLTSELTIKAVKETLSKHLDDAAKAKLIDNSIALLAKLK